MPEGAGTKGRLDGAGRPGRLQSWTPVRGSCQPGGGQLDRGVWRPEQCLGGRACEALWGMW